MSEWKLFAAIVCSAGFGFLAGSLPRGGDEVPMVSREIRPELGMVTLEKIDGDALSVKVEGDVRILWAGENSLEESGKIFLGQVPTENDLKYTQFPYTGNAKTGKFYPSDSYFARGVAVPDRRFFETKEDAIAAGFIPSKSVE